MDKQARDKYLTEDVFIFAVSVWLYNLLVFQQCLCDSLKANFWYLMFSQVFLYCN